MALCILHLKQRPVESPKLSLRESGASGDAFRTASWHMFFLIRQTGSLGVGLKQGANSELIPAEWLSFP